MRVSGWRARSTAAHGCVAGRRAVGVRLREARNKPQQSQAEHHRALALPQVRLSERASLLLQTQGHLPQVEEALAAAGVARGSDAFSRVVLPQRRSHTQLRPHRGQPDLSPDQVGRERGVLGRVAQRTHRLSVHRRHYDSAQARGLDTSLRY